MSFGSSGGAIVQLPFVETNAERKERPVIWKARYLQGWRGTYTRLSEGYSKFLVGSLPQPEAVAMHWGLQIGPYLHELVTDEGLNGHLMNRRLHEDQPEFWQSAAPAPDRVICNTSLTDREIYQHAIEVRELMSSGEPAFSKKGRYHYSSNNCQNFAVGLAGQLVLAESDVDVADTSKEEWKEWRIMAACTYGKSWELGKQSLKSPSAYFEGLKDVLGGRYRQKHYPI